MPELDRLGVSRPINCHYRARKPLLDVWAAWEEADLLRYIPTYDGLWVPRFKRQKGSESERAEKCKSLPASELSNHSWGVAFDIGARKYPQGKKLPAGDPWWDLIQIADAFGWYNGAGYSRLPDPMHFELATI